MKIKISTWNIGSIPESEANRVEVISAVKKANADILCMQEFPDDKDLVREICDIGCYTYQKVVITSQSHVGSMHYMGVAVFCRACPVECIVHPLIKPYKSLVSFYGTRELLHDKVYLALIFNNFICVTGHGFPSVRYCSPDICYSNELQKDWKRYCVDGQKYQRTFDDLDLWIKNITNNFSVPVVIASDFNIGSPLDYMQNSKKYMKDIFEGQYTRPPQYNVGEYKTDAVLVTDSWEILSSEIHKNTLDHHMLTTTIAI